MDCGVSTHQFEPNMAMAAGPPADLHLIFKTYSSAACNVTVTHKCAVDCTWHGINVPNLKSNSRT